MQSYFYIFFSFYFLSFVQKCLLYGSKFFLTHTHVVAASVHKNMYSKQNNLDFRFFLLSFLPHHRFPQFFLINSRLIGLKVILTSYWKLNDRKKTNLWDSFLLCVCYENFVIHMILLDKETMTHERPFHSTTLMLSSSVQLQLQLDWDCSYSHFINPLNPPLGSIIKRTKRAA